MDEPPYSLVFFCCMWHRLHWQTVALLSQDRNKENDAVHLWLDFFILAIILTAFIIIENSRPISVSLKNHHHHHHHHHPPFLHYQ